MDLEVIEQGRHPRGEVSGVDVEAIVSAKSRCSPSGSSISSTNSPVVRIAVKTVVGMVMMIYRCRTVGGVIPETTVMDKVMYAFLAVAIVLGMWITIAGQEGLVLVRGAV